MDNIKKFEDFLDRMQGLLDNAKKQGHIIVRVEDLEKTFPELREEESKEKPNGGIVMEDFNEGNGFYKVNLNYLNKEQVEEIEELVKKWNPELKESEDEKIREEIKVILANTDLSQFALDYTFADMLTWLEKQGETFTKKDVDDAYLQGISDTKYELGKQGEQKSADKVEPKFHKGEWIVWQNKCYKVNDTSCGYELIDQNGLSTFLEYGTIDESAHLWDISKDAKEGDVLETEPIKGYYFPFVAIYKKQNEKDFDSYCFIGFDGEFYKGENGHSTEEVHPATKEQRDLLFTKMKEAGYEWDAEKKELKKVDARKNLTLDGDLMQADCMMIEQKPAWSEEDEEIALGIEQVMNCASLLNIVPDKIDRIRTWLKNLKQRINK